MNAGYGTRLETIGIIGDGVGPNASSVRVGQLPPIPHPFTVTDEAAGKPHSPTARIPPNDPHPVEEVPGGKIVEVVDDV